MATLKVIFRSLEKQASRNDIRDIAGSLDDAIVAAILHTGVTPGEILQAFELLEENHYTHSVFSRQMDERVRSVYNILDYARNGFNGNG